MIDAAKIAGKTYVDAFARIYATDADVGAILATSSFISCYSMMNNEARSRTLVVLFELLAQIGDERFEDGNDFVQFIVEHMNEKNE